MEILLVTLCVTEYRFYQLCMKQELLQRVPTHSSSLDYRSSPLTVCLLEQLLKLDLALTVLTLQFKQKKAVSVSRKIQTFPFEVTTFFKKFVTNHCYGLRNSLLLIPIVFLCAWSILNYGLMFSAAMKHRLCRARVVCGLSHED